MGGGNSGKEFGVRERRESTRTTAVLMPALIEIEGFAGFCLVHNISSDGMMASVYSQYGTDQSATVQFSNDVTVKGRVAWSEGGRVGVQFDELLDTKVVLRRSDGSHNTAKITRAPRLQLSCDGELVLEGDNLPVQVLDISQRGLKIAGQSVTIGEDVVVHLPGMEPRKAVARWAQDGTVGLNFISPLGFRELAEWVLARNFPQR